MKYSWDEGVDYHDDNIRKGLLAGVPIVLGLALLGPIRAAPHSGAISGSDGANIASSGTLGANGTTAKIATSRKNNSAVAGATAQSSTAPAVSSSYSNQPAANNSGSTQSAVLAGGRGGGSPTTTTSGADAGSTSTASLPSTGLTIGDKQILSTSSLDITIN